MIKRAITLLLLALPLYLAAVPQAEGRSPGPMLEVFTGRATFYSDSFHGKKTANGERYNKNEFTAAHRSLPLGTIVRVTNLSNGNNLLVRINDRGPGKKKLILDVSRAAASRLNMIRRGVIPVQVEVVADKRGIPVLRNNAFYLRLASARSRTPKTSSKRFRPPAPPSPPSGFPAACPANSKSSRNAFPTAARSILSAKAPSPATGMRSAP